MDVPLQQRSSSRRFTTLHRSVLVLAFVLAVMPAGCLFVDFSMWFINGLAIAGYGLAMGLMARSTRGLAAGIACGILGVTHPVWVFLIPSPAPWLGLPYSGPFSTAVVSQGQIVMENTWMFVKTGLVFGLVIAVCTLSWRPLAIMAVACLAVCAFMWLDYKLLPVWPLGGLWPSTLSLPAGILHAGAATSLWLMLKGDVERERGRAASEWIASPHPPVSSL